MHCAPSCVLWQQDSVSLPGRCCRPSSVSGWSWTRAGRARRWTADGWAKTWAPSQATGWKGTESRRPLWSSGGGRESARLGHMTRRGTFACRAPAPPPHAALFEPPTASSHGHKTKDSPHNGKDKDRTHRGPPNSGRSGHEDYSPEHPYASLERAHKEDHHTQASRKQGKLPRAQGTRYEWLPVQGRSSQVCQLHLSVRRCR